MKPYERIRYTFYNLLQKLLISIGHNYLVKDEFKPSPYSFSLYAVNILGLLTCVYTVIVYDIPTGLNAIGYGAISIQVN